MFTAYNTAVSLLIRNHTHHQSTVHWLFTFTSFIQCISFANNSRFHIQLFTRAVSLQVLIIARTFVPSNRRAPRSLLPFSRGFHPCRSLLFYQPAGHIILQTAALLPVMCRSQLCRSLHSSSLSQLCISWTFFYRSKHLSSSQLDISALQIAAFFLS